MGEEEGGGDTLGGGEMRNRGEESAKLVEENYRWDTKRKKNGWTRQGEKRERVI